ncbi:putative NADP(+)-dependent dehydrogenase [Aspergillus sclerotioniger CBS 115572]|uniref:Putative NADP(+)-dependent dehydrogenase n=1 Tax=Aspergillus sclerotioniger CBS 115572 TaxID=1450535 RepID=A0A317XFL0_9EURO|nr:putative NADP(+)-dependent dehydrogenase [Aspergillus sclerotioniger CBS 115572]PWY96632.1 putative NADP(+)-dependent dehydrogenase [Aspergillus sclerotioniger CBS 115572]
MNPPLPSLTPTWHNDTYPSISPSRPELTAAGKTIIITGAGGSIGRATALSFCRAGASKIILVGRNESNLKATQDALTCDSSVHALGVTDESGLAELAATIGPWDILILGAGYLSGPSSIASSVPEDWWLSFETNVKGAYLPIKHLLPTANTTHATIIAITAATTFPATMVPGLSAYLSSKLALHKVLEFVAAENQTVFAAALHPGMIETDVFKKSGGDKEKLPMDSVNLPADFTVWLASPEAAFLNGRQVWANWDVEELKAKGEEIKNGMELMAGVYGWPFHA